MPVCKPGIKILIVRTGLSGGVGERDHERARMRVRAARRIRAQHPEAGVVDLRLRLPYHQRGPVAGVDIQAPEENVLRRQTAVRLAIGLGRCVRSERREAQGKKAGNGEEDVGTNLVFAPPPAARCGS
jgi:hypothetical protein